MGNFAEVLAKNQSENVYIISIWQSTYITRYMYDPTFKTNRSLQVATISVNPDTRSAGAATISINPARDTPQGRCQRGEEVYLIGTW